MDVCGNRFFMYTAIRSAYAQYSGPRSAEYRAHRIIWAKTRLGDSAIPFWADDSAPVTSSVKPSSWIIFENACERPSSLPWSVRTVRCGSEDLNFCRTFLAISVGGSLFDVRNTHMYRVALSIMSR